MPTTSPLQDLAEFEINSDYNPDATEGFAPKVRSYLWGYWRKGDGEILAAPNWPTEYMLQVDQGWKSLRQYGEFALQQAGWNVNREPYRLIFANGGAKEFGPAQIVGHNWHRRPPYKGVKFPQLDMALVGTATCKFCRKQFSSYSPEPGEGAIMAEVNLGKHESVGHKDASQNAGLARALKEGLLDPKAAAALPSSELTALMQQMANTQDLILRLLAEREPVVEPPVVIPTPRPQAANDSTYDMLRATTPPGATKR